MRALLLAVAIAGCTFARPADLTGLENVTLSIESGNDQSGTVGTSIASPIVIAARDPAGNSVANVTLELAVTGGGHVDLPAITTDVQGNARTVLTLGTVPGANTVEARISGDDDEPAIATATAIVGAPTSLSIASGDGQTGVAGDALAAPLVALVADQFGNPVPDILVELAVTAGNGAVPHATTTTDANGHAQTSLVLDTTVGTNRVEARVLGLTTTFTATGIAGAPAQLFKTAGDAQSAAAGSTLAQPFVVTVEDAHGNPVAGVAVAFEALTAGGNVTTSSATTAADGTASTTYQLTSTTGINHVSAAVAGLPALDFVARWDPLESTCRHASLSIL